MQCSLQKKKALHFSYAIQDNDTILITADTIVCLGDKVLGKPGNFEEAFEMLQMLSGKEHKVYTGVALKSLDKTFSFYAVTNVHFSVLSPEEITHYITHFKPYDKAGAYGIQEWIGYIAIDRIEGSYFNVVGLPVHRLYSELKKF